MCGDETKPRCWSLADDFALDWLKQVVFEVPNNAFDDSNPEIAAIQFPWLKELGKFRIPRIYDFPGCPKDTKQHERFPQDKRDPLANFIDLVLWYIQEQEPFYIQDEDLMNYYNSGGIAKITYEQALAKANKLLNSRIDRLRLVGDKVMQRVQRIHEMRQLLNKNVKLFTKLGAKVPQELITRYHNLFAYEVAFAYYLG